jgi:hypothetical protein
MTKRRHRSGQWITQAMAIDVMGAEPSIGLTLEGWRPSLNELSHDQAPLITAWTVTAVLDLAARGQIVVVPRNGVIRLHLDRIPADVPENVRAALRLDRASRDRIVKEALERGSAANAPAQRSTIGIFLGLLLANGFPPFRVDIVQADLSRLRQALEQQPFRVALQIHLLGTAPMFAKRRPQPRGPKSALGIPGSSIGFLAAVAEILLEEEGVVAIARALIARRGHIRRDQPIGKLEMIHGLVANVLEKRWQISLEELHASPYEFARVYLYPHKASHTPQALSASRIEQVRSLFLE